MKATSQDARETNGGAEHTVQDLRELADDLLFASSVQNGHVLLVLDQLDEV